MMTAGIGALRALLLDLEARQQLTELIVEQLTLARVLATPHPAEAVSLLIGALTERLDDVAAERPLRPQGLPETMQPILDLFGARLLQAVNRATG